MITIHKLFGMISDIIHVIDVNGINLSNLNWQKYRIIERTTQLCIEQAYSWQPDSILAFPALANA